MGYRWPANFERFLVPEFIGIVEVVVVTLNRHYRLPHQITAATACCFELPMTSIPPPVPCGRVGLADTQTIAMISRQSIPAGHLPGFGIGRAPRAAWQPTFATARQSSRISTRWARPVPRARSTGADLAPASSLPHPRLCVNLPAGQTIRARQVRIPYRATAPASSSTVRTPRARYSCDVAMHRGQVPR